MKYTLPNLQRLAGQSDFEEVEFIFDPSGTVKILDKNPNRYSVIITTREVGNIYLTTQPGPYSLRGLLISANQQNKFLYSELLEWMQSDLYITTDQLTLKLTIVETILNNPE